LRRFLSFFDKIVSNSHTETTQISEEFLVFFEQVLETLRTHQHLLSGKVSNRDRKIILDGLGEAGSRFRTTIYSNSLTGKKASISIETLKEFIEITQKYLEHTIAANKRTDNLYHAYNLMTLENSSEISISHLDEMLEGQVAVLSSGYLKASEVLNVLNAMKNSKLFREDQYSYLLYPNKELPRFMVKNTIPKKAVEKSKLLQQLLQEGNSQIITKDINGVHHFNGNFNNVNSLKSALSNLKNTKYASLVQQEESLLLQTFEEVFNHKAFTGRSGTFYGYEGLGSIYWHMVSKLQLAVLECCLHAIDANEDDDIVGRLLEHYYEINDGIGVHKSPKLYGAFPTDPYSHTPEGKGAQQPGMTGQVKEDILSRIGELGVFVNEGQLMFHPCLLRKDEFLEDNKTFDYIDVNKTLKHIELVSGSLAFTYCQIPVIYKMSGDNKIEVIYKDNSVRNFNSLTLDKETSNNVFDRSGEIESIVVSIHNSILK